MQTDRETIPTETKQPTDRQTDKQSEWVSESLLFQHGSFISYKLLYMKAVYKYKYVVYLMQYNIKYIIKAIS